jgi:alcohol dehydrogenase class IV
VTETSIEALSAAALEDSCHQTNPVPVTRADFAELYRRCL